MVNPLVWAAILVTVSFLLQGNIGINMADEGYLWYGAIRTALGDVPIRDFQSYDPGRYYWVAMWFKVFGTDGIISLRIAVAIFQWIGLSFGLSVLRRYTKSWWYIGAGGFLLLIWMYPRHKLFEPSLAMASVYFATLLIENATSLRRYFISGIFIGIAAFIGRNHGLYSFLAFFLLILFLYFKVSRQDFWKRTLTWGSGIILGYSPMVLMMVGVPGFFVSFVSSIKDLFRIGSTNLPLPVPWPWLVKYSEGNIGQSISLVSTGLFFLGLIFFCIIGSLYIVRLPKEEVKRNAALIAACCVGIFYTHYAFSRADLGHLAQGVHPILIGVLAMLYVVKTNIGKKISKWVFVLVLLFSLLSVGTASPFFLKESASKGEYRLMNISGSKLWIDKGTSQFIEGVEQINNEQVKGEKLLIAPYWPTFYPILDRKSPLKDIYFLFPQTEERQKEMIKELELEKVNWVILGDIALDGRDELRFKNTHKLVYEYLMNNFNVIHTDKLPSDHVLLHRK